MAGPRPRLFGASAAGARECCHDCRSMMTVVGVTVFDGFGDAGAGLQPIKLRASCGISCRRVTQIGARIFAGIFTYF